MDQNLKVGFLALLIGTVLLLVGLALYAQAKGRSSWWWLMGLLSCIGLIVLYCLKDKSLLTPTETKTPDNN